MPTQLEEDIVRHLLQRGELGELMGLTEVAKECGSKPSNVRDLVGLPEPVVTYLPNRPLWLASEVREFAAERRRRMDW